MADEADVAFDTEQQHLAEALAAQRRRGSVLRPVGNCHFCESPVLAEGSLFCDADCAADWEYENALRRKVGIARHRPVP